MRCLDEIFLSNEERAAFFRVAHGRKISMDMENRLGSAGLVTLVACNPKRGRAECELTTTGERYLDYLRAQQNERRWTRGLAIAAIIISLIALVLELDDRGYLGGLLSGLKTTRIETPALKR